MIDPNNSVKGIGKIVKVTWDREKKCKFPGNQ
jgi:hypothetical protein